MELVASFAHRDKRWVLGFPYTFLLLILAQLFQLFCLASNVFAYYEGSSGTWSLMRGSFCIIVIIQLLGAMLNDPERYYKEVFISSTSYYIITLGLSDPTVVITPAIKEMLTWQADVYLCSFLYIVALAALALLAKIVWLLISLCNAKLFLRLHGFKDEETKKEQ